MTLLYSHSLDVGDLTNLTFSLLLDVGDLRGVGIQMVWCLCSLSTVIDLVSNYDVSLEVEDLYIESELKAETSKCKHFPWLSDRTIISEPSSLWLNSQKYPSLTCQSSALTNHFWRTRTLA